MLVGMRLLEHLYLLEVVQLPEGLVIDGHDTERGHEAVGGAGGEAAKRHAMRRSEQHHATNDAAAVDDAGIHAGGDGAGINVTGMEDDDGLGRRGSTALLF